MAVVIGKRGEDQRAKGKEGDETERSGGQRAEGEEE
jgi:hypothetical protein